MKSLLILEDIVARTERAAKKKNTYAKPMLEQYKRAEEVYIERFGYQPEGSRECYRTVEQIKNADITDSEKQKAYQVLEDKEEIIPELLAPLRKRISKVEKNLEKRKKKSKKKKPKPL